ncbi:MAG: HAMP domain-containing sensor histidine kinase [Saprospiraceae bacterium]
MKLITKTSYYYLAISILLFIAASAIFYFYISQILNEDITEAIAVDKNTVLNYVRTNDALPPISPLSEDIVTYIPIDQPREESLVDTMLLGPLKDEYLPYRQLMFPVNVREQPYTVVLQKPLFQKDDLLETFATSLAFFTLFLVLILFLTSRWLSNRFWQPFYKTLGQLRKIEFHTNKNLILEHTDTDEFRQLNEEIVKMSTRIREQYRNLKEFSENASHEIQTPLAIIRNKLELLMQSGRQSEEELKWVHDAFESASRLSRLTQSLLLLSKIENRQYTQTESVSLHELIREKLTAFDDIRSIRSLNVQLNAESEIVLTMNPHLADILISNILTNAFRHSQEGGEIRIDLKHAILIASNTGLPLTKEAASLFNRFAKDSVSSESSGLGLSIVQQICNVYHFNVKYEYADGWHRIIIHF